VLGEAPRRMADLVPELPAPLCAVVERCLRKAPDDRYAHVAELAEELVPFAGEHGRAAARSIRSIVSRPGTVEEAATPGVSSSASTMTFTTQRQASGEVRARVGRLVWPGVAAAAIVATAVLILGATRHAAPPRAEEPPAQAAAAPAPALVVTPLHETVVDAGPQPAPTKPRPVAKPKPAPVVKPVPAVAAPPPVPAAPDARPQKHDPFDTVK
jgi:hypothetical protein